MLQVAQGGVQVGTHWKLEVIVYPGMHSSQPTKVHLVQKLGQTEQAPCEFRKNPFPQLMQTPLA